MSSRKIPRHLENEFDNIIIDIVDKINPYLKKLNFTPNIITTISFFFGIIMLITYYKNYYYLTALFLLLSYFFDCIDGNFARTYNMQTKFGDYYDHITDWLVFGILFILILIKKIPNKIKLLYFLIIIILLILTGFYSGCTEKYIKKNKSNIHNSSLELIMCPDIKYMNILKYFGCGTLIIVLIIIILSHKLINN